MNFFKKKDPKGRHSIAIDFAILISIFLIRKQNWSENRTENCVKLAEMWIEQPEI